MRAYTKTVRADAEERTRAALLEAATSAFFEDGWASVSLQRVAAEAGVTKQTLLRHFGSKEGLAQAAFERAMRDVSAQRAQAPAGDLDAIVDNLLDHYEAVGERALKLEAMPAGAPFVQEGRALHYAWVDRVFEPLLRCASERPRRRAALIAICDVHSWRVLSRHLGLTRAEVRATLLHAIRGALA